MTIDPALEQFIHFSTRGGPTRLTLFTEGQVIQGQLGQVSEYLQAVRDTVCHRAAEHENTAWAASLEENIRRAREFEASSELVKQMEHLHLFHAGLVTPSGSLFYLPQETPVSVAVSAVTGWAPALLVDTP